MVTIPTTLRPIARLSVDTSGESLQSLGQQVENISGDLIRYDSYKQQENERQVAQQTAIAKANLNTEMTEFMSSLRDDKEYDSYVSRFDSVASDVLSRTSSQISDENVRKIYQAQMTANLAGMRDNVIGSALKIRDDEGVARLESGLNQIANLYPLADSQSRRKLKEDAYNMIGTHMGTSISRQQAIRKRMDIDSLFDEQDILSLPAAEALNALNGKTPQIARITDYSEPVQEAIMLASNGNPDDADFLIRLAKIESNGNPHAVNSSSGATGLFQFIPKTASEFGINPKDPYQSAEATIALRNRNKQVLSENLGRTPSNAELYLAHQQGATGASKLLLSPDAKASDVVNPKAIIQNGGTLDMTAGEFANMWMNKYDGRNYAELAARISPAKRDSLIKEKQREIQAMLEEQDRQRQIAQVQSALRGDTYLDYSNNEQMKIYDSYFRDTVIPEANAMGDYAVGNGFIAQHIVNAGVVPKSVKADIRGKLRSGNQDMIVAASDLLSQLQENEPQLINDFSNDEIQMAVSVMADMRSGIPAPLAVANAQEAINIQNTPVYEQRKLALTEKATQETIRSNAATFFNTWMPFEGETVNIAETREGAALYTDYKRAYEQTFLRTNDHDKASEYASLIIGGKYAKSQFNDGVIMQYAPDVYYSIPNQDNDWMYKQFKEWAGERTGLEVFDESRWRIMPDSRTAREASTGQPSYAVVKIDDYGFASTQPERWKPDRQKQVDKLREMAAQARAERQRPVIDRAKERMQSESNPLRLR